MQTNNADDNGLPPRFCAAYDDMRDYLRERTRLHEVVPAQVQREQFYARFTALRALVPAA